MWCSNRGRPLEDPFGAADRGFCVDLVAPSRCGARATGHAGPQEGDFWGSTRIPAPVDYFVLVWGVSSVGRASRLQREGHRFKPDTLHLQVMRFIALFVTPETPAHPASECPPMQLAHLARRPVVAAALFVAALALPRAPIAAQERVDIPTIERIKAEADQRSQVMDILSWLTDVHGPRLTGSSISKAAGDWTIGSLTKWGLTNVHYESFGPFGRGWVAERFSANMIEPHPFQLIGYSGAWSVGTKGPATGEVVRVRLDSMPDLEAARGTLRGKWVIMAPARELQAQFQPLAARYSDDQLAGLAAIVPAPAQPGGRGAGGGRGRGGAGAGGVNFPQERVKFLMAEGVHGILQPGGGRSDGGTVFVSSTGARMADQLAGVPTIVLTPEHYGRISRILDRNVPVKVEINSQVRFENGDLNSFNILAEIPGTDPKLKDEVVMLGAHFDSWHTGTGATDNAAGSAVMLEAVRILKALDLKPRRTIRIGLWTGEEQGLIGSRAYIAEHFAARDSMGALKTTPAYDKFSAYFNVDNGTGKIRGVYQQMNAGVGPIFDAWMEPFKADGMKTLTLSNTGGTDHQSFDGIGLPGFQFIQDPVEYSSRTHHSNMDVYERVQAADMKWNSAVLAAFVWQAAQRDEKLPRKPMP